MIRSKTARFLPALLAATCLVVLVAAHADAQNVPAPPDVAAPPSDAEKSSSGLASKVLTAGTGTAHPGETSRVTVRYTGWTTDGNMFDRSRSTSSFYVDEVIRGWIEGLQLMVVGEKRRFWIPEELAYRGRRSPYGMLVFDVELLAFQ